MEEEGKSHRKKTDTHPIIVVVVAFFPSLFLFGFVLFTHLHLTKLVNISLGVEKP